MTASGGSRKRPVRPVRARVEPAVAPASGAPVLLARFGPLAAAGNRALTHALADRALQRAAAAGWDRADATGRAYNAGRRVESGINRVPVDGLTTGNQQAFSGDHTARDKTIEAGGANERAKTSESAAGRAIALIPQGLNAALPVSVLLHLHGYTSRSWDPYGGWRQRKGDHTVRDVALDRIEAQMAAAGQRRAEGDPVQDGRSGDRTASGEAGGGVVVDDGAHQTVAILPQGVGHSEFGGLEPSSYIAEVLGRLATIGPAEKIPVPDPAKGFQLILSAHSGGGATVAKALAREGKPPGRGRATAGGASAATAAVEVILFEAINPGDLEPVEAWVDGHLERTLSAFTAAKGDPAGQRVAIAACPVLRAYRTASTNYAKPYDALDRHLTGWFEAAEHVRVLGDHLTLLRDHFRVSVLTGTSDHEQTVRGLGDDPAGGPLADALAASRHPNETSKLQVSDPRAKKKAPAAPKAAALGAEPAAATVEGPAARPPTVARPTGDVFSDLGSSTLDLLPAAERSRFAAIVWVPHDYPKSKLKIKDTSEENLETWRSKPGYTVYSVTAKGGAITWYAKGTHQREAQLLFDALARVRPGGGERRVNTGSTALLTSEQFRTNPAAFDKYVEGQLDDVRSYDRGSSSRLHTDRLNKHAVPRFAALLAAAAADGVFLSINNSFRTRARALENATRADNAKAVAKYSAHSLGLAVDLNLWTAGMGKRLAEASTAMTNLTRMLSAPSYKWMFERGAAFGFYQYRNEPWHWEFNPDGFRETFWADAPGLTPVPEEPPSKKRKKKAAG